MLHHLYHLHHLHPLRIALLSLLILLVAACTESPAPDDYFPLQKGLSWHYRIHTDFLTRKETSSLTMTNLGPTTLGEHTLYIRRSSDGTDYYIEKGEYGVYRYGKRTIVELKPRIDESPRLILPEHTQQNIKPWKHLTHPYTFRRVSPTEVSMTDEIQLEMSYELTAMDETVSVPAGTFEHCLKVEGLGQFSMYVDPKDGHKTIDVITTEWYAPGVGLVKLIRSEPINASTFKGGEIVMELVETSF